jgi:hypothetical protein
MIVLLVLTGAYVFAPTGFQTSTAHLRPVLVLETLLILAFSASWFTKGCEMAAASKQQSVGGAAAGKSLNPPS